MCAGLADEVTQLQAAAREREERVAPQAQVIWTLETMVKARDKSVEEQAVQLRGMRHQPASTNLFSLEESMCAKASHFAGQS